MREQIASAWFKDEKTGELVFCACATAAEVDGFAAARLRKKAKEGDKDAALEVAKMEAQQCTLVWDE